MKFQNGFRKCLMAMSWLVIAEITSNVREIRQLVSLRGGYLRYTFENVESLPRIILTGDST